MASDALVLLTGATGFIGFRTLVLTLKAGYRVRAAVRSEAKGQSIADNPQIKALTLNPGQLTFAIVPDFLASGAFDEAAKDVEYILHLASPIPRPVPKGEDPKAWFLAPAVQGTLGVFESAKKSPSVKRIVVTSSAVAIISLENISKVAAQDVVTAEDRVAVPDKFNETDPGALYCVSKIAALNAAEAWIKSEKPHFDVIHLHPSYVLGRNDTISKPEGLLDGSNATAMTVAVGKKNPTPYRVGTVVHINDVARAHVESLNPRVAGNQSFVLSTLAIWEQIPRIAEKYFPEAVKKGILSTEGYQRTLPMVIDVWKTEETFGKLITFEDQARELMGQYVELKG